MGPEIRMVDSTGDQNWDAHIGVLARAVAFGRWMAVLRVLNQMSTQALLMMENWKMAEPEKEP